MHDVAVRDGDVLDAVLVDIGDAHAPAALFATLWQPFGSDRDPVALAVAEEGVDAVDAANLIQGALAGRHDVWLAVVVEVGDRDPEGVHRGKALIGQLPRPIGLLDEDLDPAA